MLVVVLVLENPDCFAIRLTEQISCRTSVSFRSRNPIHRGRARRRGRGRFQTSDFGFDRSTLRQAAPAVFGQQVRHVFLSTEGAKDYSLG